MFSRFLDSRFNLHAFSCSPNADNKKDKDGALSVLELENLLLTTPGFVFVCFCSCFTLGNPWIDYGFPFTSALLDKNAITLQGFLSLWSLLCRLNIPAALAHLAFLGHDEPMVAAIQLLPLSSTSRSVYQCLLLGGTGCGKVACLIVRLWRRRSS